MELPCGIHVRIAARGNGFVVVERETREPLQYVTHPELAESLLAQWDDTIGAQIKKAERR